MGQQVLRRKLDKTRPHGIVTPPYEGGSFEQDGVLYDAQGDILLDRLTPDEKARLEPPPEAKGPPSPDDEIDEGGADLRSWATGQQKVPFHKIRKMIQEKYHQQAFSIGAALDILVENDLVKKDEIASSLK